MPSIIAICLAKVDSANTSPSKLYKHSSSHNCHSICLETFLSSPSLLLKLHTGKLDESDILVDGKRSLGTLPNTSDEAQT